MFVDLNQQILPILFKLSIENAIYANLTALAFIAGKFEYSFVICKKISIIA